MRKYAGLSIAFIVLGTAMLGFFITKLRFDYNFENFFPVGDPDLTYYLEFREKFENDNDYLLLGLEAPKNTIFDSTFLSNTDQFINEIKKIPTVEGVFSIVQAKEPIISRAGSVMLSVLHQQDPNRYAQDSIEIFTEKKYLNSLISENGNSIALLIKHTQNIKKAPADSLREAIYDQLKRFQLSNFHLSGKAVAQQVYIGKMQYELFIFVSSSIILVTIILILTYRSFKNTVVPLIIVLLTVVWTLGFMGVVGKKLDILLILLPSILFVVGMSDVVHILTRYIAELRKGLEKYEALKITIKEIGLATFLTSFTTAVGFLTLITAVVKPVKEFGIFIALGVLIAFVLAFTLLPSILVFTQTPILATNEKLKNQWHHFLSNAFLVVIKNKNKIIIGNIILLIFSGIGISMIQKNSYLIDDIPKNDPMRLDFTFFDENFGGSRPYELAIEVVDSSLNILSPSVLKAQDKLQQFIQDSCQMQIVSSPVMLIKQLHQSVQGGQFKFYRIPKNEKEFKILKKYNRLIKRGNKTLKVFDESKKIGRFSGRSADAGSIVSNQQRVKLNQFIKHHIDSTKIKVIHTGTSLLIEKNNEYITQTMLEGLVIAFGVIAIIAALLFGSLRMSLITLIPNVIPLIFLGGIMGLFGISLKLSTSIVFTIAFGIAVDDTIHFISKLKLELRKGNTIFKSVKNTFLTTGKAIIITTFILMGGFLLLLFSSFGGTFYTGLMVSLTLFMALIVDLTLLPVLVLKFYKPKIKSERK